MSAANNVRESGDIAIVDVHGKITLGEESAAVRETVNQLLAKGKKKILLNLKNVGYIDSSGLGMLVSAFTTVKKAGGELKLSNLSEKASDLMQITKLYTVFDIADDEASAVASFGKLAASA